MRHRAALLAALGADNFGSGMFLPLSLVYLTRVVGLSLGVAGTLVALGTAAGLAAPALAGRLVDRFGPKPVFIGAELLQALGALAYLLARGAPPVVVAAMLLAAGQQAFYSSLFALISDVTGTGPRDRPFTVANMVRSACFGLGGLAAAGLLTTAGPAGLRAAVAGDAASFVACAVMLALLVRVARPQPSRGVAPADAASRPAPQRPGRFRVLADRPFLGLIAVMGLVDLAGDLSLTGTPVYALEVLHTRPWLPGTILAVQTALYSVAGTAVLRATRRLSRLSAMRAGAALYVVWCLASLAAIAVPPPWRPAELLSSTVILAAAGLVIGSRANALAEAAAPPAARGRYLAAFQYAFTAAGLVVPAVVALYSVAAWLPWILGAVSASAAILGLRRLASRLPAAALTSQVNGVNGPGTIAAGGIRQELAYRSAAPAVPDAEALR